MSDGHIDNRYRPAAAAAGGGGAFIIETETIANISTGPGHGDTQQLCKDKHLTALSPTLSPSNKFALEVYVEHNEWMVCIYEHMIFSFYDLLYMCKCCRQDIKV